MAHGSWDLILVMGDTDQAQPLLLAQPVQEAQDHLAAIWRKRLARLVQYQQAGILHQSPGKQNQSPLAEGKVAEGHTF
jgi:hypothetical protein